MQDKYTANKSAGAESKQIISPNKIRPNKISSNEEANGKCSEARPETFYTYLQMGEFST